MPKIIDAQGREHEAIIAELDVLVHDPIMGFSRQIIAGQPVPGELEDAYLNAADEKPPKKRVVRAKRV